MESVKSQTISGFNEYINTLRKQKNVLFTLTKFNSDKVDIVYNGVPLSDVKELTNDNYRPNYFTPLYDAIGRTIKSLGDAKNVLLVIQTDGQENSSKEFTRQVVFDLVTEKKKEGWTFVFLGADMDAYGASAAIGISKGNTVNYAGIQTQNAFSRVATASLNYTSRGSTPTEDFFKENDD